jgi:YfiH family protein
MGDWIASDWPAPRNIVAGTMLRTGDASNPPLPGKPCWLNQVHGNSVVRAADYDAQPQADGSFSVSAAHNCVVRTADCLPVLLCSVDGKVVGAAHAGWRGLAAGIIENVIASLDVAPSDLLVWLGPAISQQSFEVGDDVRDKFLACDPEAEACFEVNSRGRWQADLYGLARQRLAIAGVPAVFGGGYCTYQDEERFHSYRRDPDCGRLLSFIGMTGP